MRKNAGSYSGRMFSDRKWIIPFFASLLVSVSLILTAMLGAPSSAGRGDQLTRSEDSSGYFVESDLERSYNDNVVTKMEAPRFAYLISGTKGDSQRMLRTLEAVYHPRNQYILHLDLEALPRERMELANAVKADPMFREVENVRVMSQSNLVTYKGPTMIACTLQAIAILLKESSGWDWFINLSASDYPLMTQDDLLHVFSNLSRDLNFIEHTRLAGWKLNQRAKPIIYDPALYLSRKSDLAWTTQRRTLPTSFSLFTGSAWVVLTRSFVEYCIWGWDNLPRTMLMYYANFVSSPEGYFHTVICNNEEFRHTAISHDLHYIAWDNPPKQHPRSLTMKDFDKMVTSNAPFARKFPKDDPVLDKIDKELLSRTHRFPPGAWCVGSSDGEADPCSTRGNDTVFRPGPGAERLRELLQILVSLKLKTAGVGSSCFRVPIILDLLDVQRRTYHLELAPQLIHDLLHVLVLRVHHGVPLEQLLHLPDTCLGPRREHCVVSLDSRDPEVNAALVEAQLLTDLKAYLEAHLPGLFLASGETFGIALVVSFLVVGLLQVQRRIEYVVHGQ